MNIKFLDFEMDELAKSDCISYLVKYDVYYDSFGQDEYKASRLLN